MKVILHGRLNSVPKETLRFKAIRLSDHLNRCELLICREYEMNIKEKDGDEYPFELIIHKFKWKLMPECICEPHFFRKADVMKVIMENQIEAGNVQIRITNCEAVEGSEIVEFNGMPSDMILYSNLFSWPQDASYVELNVDNQNAGQDKYLFKAAQEIDLKEAIMQSFMENMNDYFYSYGYRVGKDKKTEFNWKDIVNEVKDNPLTKYYGFELVKELPQNTEVTDSVTVNGNEIVYNLT